MSSALLREGSVEDLREALVGMGPYKAPGPDGFTPLFFQSNWDLIKEDLLHGFNSFLAGVFFRGALANRLKDYLPLLINESKSAFVPHCLIHDNIILAHDLLHVLKRKKNGNSGFLALKLDMAKAYDRASLAFFMCMQGRNSFWVSVWGPPISHLLFVDDALIFCRAKNPEVHRVKLILDRYEALTGQLISLEKSCLFFSPNTSDVQKNICRSFLGISIVDWSNTYLGLPAVVGRSKTSALNFISQRVSKKISSLKGCLLSKADREIIVKTVLAALPTSSMHCFRHPKKNCQLLSSAFLNFWWSGLEKSNKIKWISWEALCQSMESGGLGFKNVEAFNLALLAKLAWRMESSDGSLLFRSLKQKYFKDCSFVEAPNRPSASWVWKSVLSARAVIKKGMKWQIGDGASVQCWKDNWLPNIKNSSVTSSSTGAIVSLLVDLIHHDVHRWNSDLVSRSFNKRDCDLILQIPFSLNGGLDCKIWGASKSGRFSVSSAYSVASSLLGPISSMPCVEGSSFSAGSSAMWRSVGDVQAPQKIQLFLWQSLHDRIPVNEHLLFRGASVSPCCPVCEGGVKTVDHLLCTCPFAIIVWKLCPLRLDFGGVSPSFWPKRWVFICARWADSGTAAACVGLASFVCWTLWKCRNDFIFSRKRWDPYAPSRRLFKLFKSFKLNFDASFDSSRRLCGGGLILRNHLGFPVKVVMVFFSHVHGPSMAEGLVLQESLVLLKRWGYHGVVVEGDCRPVMQLKASEVALKMVLNDVSPLLLECLGSSLAWVPRGGNLVAHLLSKVVLKAECGDLDWSIWPSWLCIALIPD
ncbi:uncharacterized protein LOC132304678 [Cornus florida]|uniref:uncharacterized protein LOC132304678 n=1 Tax=Cornus florida TaxID=4283 RepID=UPI00289C32CF|nr:uncharacterized protein LOC132304678 [Cornus florida]